MSEALFWCPLWEQTDGTMSGNHNKTTRIVIERNSKAYTANSSTHTLFITDLDHETNVISKIRYAPLWEKISKQTGSQYYTGDDGSRIRILVHPNLRKAESSGDNPPDWIVYKISKDKTK
jgi:hypothetical protein